MDEDEYSNCKFNSCHVTTPPLWTPISIASLCCTACFFQVKCVLGEIRANHIISTATSSAKVYSLRSGARHGCVSTSQRSCLGESTLWKWHLEDHSADDED